MIINIFGSTGIIGSKTLKIINKYFPEINVNLLVSNNNVNKLIYQIKKYSPSYVYINDENKSKILRDNIDSKIKILDFNDLINYLNETKSDLTLLSISGYKSLYYFESIIKNTSSLGLVNKEAIVSAGHLFKNFTNKNKNKIFPLDSEHFSIFKNLQKNNLEIKNLILTASGGPFLGQRFNSLKDISFNKASKHPKWKMGYKNSIDSATLVNKCLELIEAHYLFNVPFDKLKIIIHPESKIHSIFEYESHLYNFIGFHNDMTIPIFHFLNQKGNLKLSENKFDMKYNEKLNFLEVKKSEFPIYNYFKSINKSIPKNLINFNVANEFAVNLFKNNRIKYTEILKIITKIASINLNYKLNNIRDIINYHELLEKKINEKINIY